MTATWTDQVTSLLHRVPAPPGEPVPSGIARETSRAHLHRLNLRPPESLLDWLAVSNGPCVGPGGIFGLGTSRPSLDIEQVLGSHPNWGNKNWIPVAGDGCGNYFVLIGDARGAPVGFIDTIRDPEEIEYLAASTLPRFLQLLLRRELGEAAGWPFSRELLETLDAELLSHEHEWPMPFSVPR